ncbi:MAG: protein-L-isoaspartate(D-aspartate) O-methyltransferase, partial [Planctomycetota bacterium]
MVRDQIEHPRFGGMAVTDQRVLEAMRHCPRHAFVPKLRRGQAYADSPLPIGHGQTISQPYMVAIMTELLELTPETKVLEIGTGSGYQAAVLAHLTPQVYTIEIIEPLAKRAQKVLRQQQYTEVNCRHADGYFGWKEEAPFDAIIVTCAAGHLPPPLWEQLKPGGRIVIPIGGP